MARRPRIGITCDYQADGERCVARHPYATAVLRAGGAPLILPQIDAEHLDDQLAVLDGVIFTGGDDYHPRHFNQEPHESLKLLHPIRERYDLLLIARVRQLALPTLCICGGMQLAAIHFGAQLIQDLPSQQPGPIDHREPDFGKLVHPIHVAPDSQCSSLLGEGPFDANSQHHQAVDEQTLPAGLMTSARAPDGVIEALELVPDGPLDNGGWFLAVQWHPEWLHEQPPHDRLFSGLVAACAERR